MGQRNGTEKWDGEMGRINTGFGEEIFVNKIK
jgi:hypothetical protein